MRRRELYAVFLVLLAVQRIGWASSMPCPSGLQDPVSKEASAYLAQVSGVTRSTALKIFYGPCSYALAWTREGHLTPQAVAMIVALDNAEEKGLRPQDYDSPNWNSRNCVAGQCGNVPIELARFDVALTTAVMRYVSDLIYGRVRPLNPKAGYTSAVDQERVALLVWSDIVASVDVPASIQHLEPQAPGYLRTEEALRRFVKLARDSPDVALPSFRRAIHPGDSSESLIALATRLEQLGDLTPERSSEVTSIYDGKMVDAIKRFQTSHGIAATGTIDAAVWKQLSIPLHSRTNQLALTLERWRWIPHPLSNPPIVVNIPEFRVRAYDDQSRVALSMSVIVGKAPRRKTPVLQAALTQIVFHPYWNVPTSIQIREIAPHVAKNPAYLRANRYQVLNRNGVVIENIDAVTIQGIRSGSLRVRQIPGYQNALGTIKFVFPNAYDVYMHGTPQQSLFREDRRDFSHGCIRVEDPYALAWWVLSHEKGWSQERVSGRVADLKTYTVALSHQIPVLIVYGTGIAAEDGSVRFFNDIYGHDFTLEKSLDKLSRERQILNAAPRR